MLLGAAGVAAQFKVTEEVGEEIITELTKDLTKVQVAVPGKVFDNRQVWTSTANVKKVWGDYIRKEIEKSQTEDVATLLAQKVDFTVNRLVRAIDQDLSVADLENKKVILQMPKINVRNVGVFRKEPILELKAGAEHKVGFLKGEEVRVGYIQESLVDVTGKKLFAR